MDAGAVFLIAGVAALIGIVVNIVGVIAAFKKKWYLGVAALIVPGFATVVGLGKVCKKDLLK